MARPRRPRRSWPSVAVIRITSSADTAVLAEFFSKEITGRANGALNVFHFGAAFVIQYIIGVVVARWPGQDGHYPAVAYQVAFGLILALQASALAWFAFSRVRTRPLILLSAFRHRALQRAQIALSSTTPRLHLASAQLRSKANVPLARRGPGVGQPRFAAMSDICGIGGSRQRHTPHRCDGSP